MILSEIARDGLAGMGEKAIGGGLGIIITVALDSAVGGPLTIAEDIRDYDRQTELVERGDYQSSEAFQNVLRLPRPEEWFPYDTFVETTGGFIAGALVFSALWKRLVRERKKANPPQPH